MHNQATPNAQLHARELRRAMTDSERRRWSRLRMEQLGVKFRRQHPLGNFIADFACLSARLIVELDGSQHLDQQGYDEQRDAFFRSRGYVVLRFPTDQPFVNLEGVLSVIASEIVARGPHPNLPPEGKE